MPFRIQWVGLSLMLHLVVWGAVTHKIKKSAKLPPQVITVTLVSPGLAQLRPVPVAVLKRVAAKRVGQPRPVAVGTRTPAPNVVPQEPLRKEVKVPSEITGIQAAHRVARPTASIVQPLHGTEKATTLPPEEAVVVVRPVQGPVAIKETQLPEQQRQRYAKMHFAYIRDVIASQLVYPPMAKKMGWDGRTVVTFIIMEDGGAKNIRVTESSGYKLLDKSAMEAVRNAAPFTRPPLQADITVPVSFRILK